MKISKPKGQIVIKLTKFDTHNAKTLAEKN